MKAGHVGVPTPAAGPSRPALLPTPPLAAMLVPPAVLPPPAAAARRGPRERNPPVDPLTANKVHVSGFPPYTQPSDLVRVFGRFGNVRVEKIVSRLCFAYLVFNTPEEANNALQANKKVNIYGEFVQVKPYGRYQEKQQPQQPKREFIRTKQKGVIVEPQQIDLKGDFHEQMSRVLGSVRLTQEEATSVSSLYADVERVLQPQWPGCVAMPFGSITTGLGIKTSDADCYVHIPPQFQHPNANFIAKAKRILQSYPALFAELLSIPRANTPIIKFFHIPTETNCDLSFKTPLGAQNSKLIAFLLHADPRLIPMSVVIKYWAKVHNLSGTGKLTNYALTMMIIFYLQQPPLSILPAVEQIQRDPRNDVIVDFWNTGFNDQKDKLPPITNSSPIADLLGGFFEYYNLFDFDEMVVCPYLGKPIKKDLFRCLEDLPDEYERYKNNVFNNCTAPMRFMAPMCVQDPFEQCHNVASAITSRLAAEIRAYFKFAANAYEKEKSHNCKDFLKIILIHKPKIVRTKNHPEYRINLFPKIISNIVDPEWKDVVREIVLTIFGEMLKITLGKVEEKVNPDSKKEKEKYSGIVTKGVWKRKQFTRLYTMVNMDFQKKQQRITEEIMNVDKNLYNIQFQLVITFSHNPKSAAILIKLTAGEAEPFKEFGNFFNSTMQNWFMAILKLKTNTSCPDTAAKIAETIKKLDGMDEDNELDSDDEDTLEEDSTANDDIVNDSSSATSEVLKKDNTINDNVDKNSASDEVVEKDSLSNHDVIKKNSTTNCDVVEKDSNTNHDVVQKDGTTNPDVIDKESTGKGSDFPSDKGSTYPLEALESNHTTILDKK